MQKSHIVCQHKETFLTIKASLSAAVTVKIPRFSLDGKQVKPEATLFSNNAHGTVKLNSDLRHQRDSLFNAGTKPNQNFASISGKMLVILSYLVVLILTAETVVTKDMPKCRNMVVPMCNSIFGANTTDHTTITIECQKELGKELLTHFIPLVHINCSCFTLMFVYLSHLPFCSVSHTDLPPLLPCCPVCHHVYHHCIPHFNKLRLPWPKHLNCTKFPLYPELCIQPPSASSIQPTTAITTTGIVTSLFYSSLHPTLSSTTPLHLITTSHTDSENDNLYYKFIRFLADFVPRLVTSLYIVFILLCLFLFCTFSFVCGLRLVAQV